MFYFGEEANSSSTPKAIFDYLAGYTYRAFGRQEE